jgi:hypothetical protein
MGLRRQPVVISLDGKERVLRYDLNALCLFEEYMKCSLGEALATQSIRATRAVIWAGMLHEDPMVKIEDAGKMEFGALQEIYQKVVEALSADTGAPARPTSAPIAIPAVSASNGRNSGQPEDMISVLTTAHSGD